MLIVLIQLIIHFQVIDCCVFVAVAFSAFLISREMIRRDDYRQLYRLQHIYALNKLRVRM
jgi:hypothetical protein